MKTKNRKPSNSNYRRPKKFPHAVTLIYKAIGMKKKKAEKPVLLPKGLSKKEMRNFSFSVGAMKLS